MSTTDEKIAGQFGSRPIATGEGVKTFTAPAHACKFTEPTEISAFKNKAGETIEIHWEGVIITPEDGLILFGTPIKSITVVSGGRGCYYLNESDL